ncbi:MAG: hypothetical protein U1A27_03055 [Phycisphaerae bacterium]
MRTFLIVTLRARSADVAVFADEPSWRRRGWWRSIYAAATLVGMGAVTAVVLAGRGCRSGGAGSDAALGLVAGGIVVTVAAVAVIGRLAQRALATVTQSPAGGAGR